MTITSSGAKCDVCGNYILPIDPEERVHTFRPIGVDRDLHCDNRCKESLLAIPKGVENNWKYLPDGPLKTLYADAAAKLETNKGQPE